MFSQEEIDAVLSDAQQAVATLSTDVGRLGSGGKTQRSRASSTPSAIAAQPARAIVAENIPPCVKRILQLKVPVRVCLAQRRMRLSEILKISPGTILEFERDVESDLDMLIGDRQIGAGRAVRCNDSFGLRITRMGDLRQRIESLTG